MYMNNMYVKKTCFYKKQKICSPLKSTLTQSMDFIKDQKLPIFEPTINFSFLTLGNHGKEFQIIC